MKRRILAGLLAWVMLFSLLPATALAAPWDGDTVIRFYVIGAGSVQGYNVEKQPMSGVSPQHYTWWRTLPLLKH